MRPGNHFLEKAAMMDQDLVAAESRARTVRSRAVGALIADTTKSLLAFAFRFIQSGLAGGRAERNAVGLGDAAPASGRWIAPQAPLVLTAAQSETVFCDAGTIWITQGDNNDIVLNAGEKLILHPVGKVVVTAMAGPALIRHGMRQPSHSLWAAKEHQMNDLDAR